MTVLQHAAEKPSRNIVGLMTGTSADGIDAVVARVRGCGGATEFEVLAFHTHALTPEMQGDLFSLFMPDALVDDLSRVNFALGALLAEAVLAAVAEAGLTPADIDLVGSHGQTIRHLPAGQPASTLQIGEASVIAQLTGITTVADFRPADMAAGGEGAPLVPLVDHLLFSDAGRGRVMLNIGGIANLTALAAGGAVDDVLAFDLGPGNMVIDGAVGYLTGGTERFDRDGARAAVGEVDEQWVERLMDHEFIRRQPPKSTGREEFGAEYLGELLARTQLSGDALIATLTSFTARLITDGILRYAVTAAPVDEVWVSGGGANNKHLMALLQKGLPGMEVASIDALGVGADAKEALCFAILANETLMGGSGNLRSATGAKRGVILGKIAPGWSRDDGGEGS